MDSNLDKLKTIKQKINLILDQNKKIKEELEMAYAKLSQAQYQLKTVVEEKEELVNKFDTVKLAKGIHLSEEDRKGLKKQLKFYIKEVDKCLASISN